VDSNGFALQHPKSGGERRKVGEPPGNAANVREVRRSAAG
jgi:hypothetical protein